MGWRFECFMSCAIVRSISYSCFSIRKLFLNAECVFLSFGQSVACSMPPQNFEERGLYICTPDPKPEKTS